MTISTIPALDRTSLTFKADVDTFFGLQLPAFADEANALAADVSTKQATASEAAITATLKAGISEAKAVLTASDATATAADRMQTGLDRASATGSASTATTQAGIATTKAVEAAASAASVVRDGSGGVAGLTLFKLNLRNAVNTLTSFLTNSNTVERTYTFPDKDLTVAGLSDLTAANTANTPAGGIAATNVQAALNELDGEKAEKGANSTITSLLGITSINGGQIGGNRNKIVNPFEINQRGLTSVADDAYCMDRWHVLTESGNVAYSKITDPESGAPYAIRLTQPDASAKRFGIAQIIESKDIRSYRNLAMNFSARVKPSFAGNVRYAILEHTGTVDVVTSDVVNNWASTTFTAGNFFIAGLNVLKTGVVAPGAANYGDISDWSALGASCNNVVLFVWVEAAQAQNATLELNRPQYESGVLRTPQEWRLNEFGLCQRYVVSMGSAKSGTDYTYTGLIDTTSSGLVGTNIPPMRGTPTLVLVDPIAAWFITTDAIGAAAVVISLSGYSLGRASLTINVAGAPFTSGKACLAFGSALLISEL